MKSIKETLVKLFSLFQERTEEETNYSKAIKQLETLSKFDFCKFLQMTGLICIGYENIVVYNSELKQANRSIADKAMYVVKSPIREDREALIGRFFIKDGRFIHPSIYNQFIEESISLLRTTEKFLDNPDRTFVEGHNLRMIYPLACSIMSIADTLYSYAKG